jgi:hypothetical protein
VVPGSHDCNPKDPKEEGTPNLHKLVRSGLLAPYPENVVMIGAAVGPHKEATAACNVSYAKLQTVAVKLRRAFEILVAEHDVNDELRLRAIEPLTAAVRRPRPQALHPSVSQRPTGT